MENETIEEKKQEIKKNIEILQQKLVNIKDTDNLLMATQLLLFLVTISIMCPIIMSLPKNYIGFIKSIICFLTSLTALGVATKLCNTHINDKKNKILGEIETKKAMLNYYENNKKEIKIANTRSLTPTKEIIQTNIIKPSLNQEIKTEDFILTNNETIKKLKEAKQKLLKIQYNGQTYIKNEKNEQKKHVKSLSKQPKNKLYPYYVGKK